MAIATAILIAGGNIGHTTEAILNFVWWAIAQPGVDRATVLPVMNAAGTYLLPLALMSPLGPVLGMTCGLASLGRAGLLRWEFALAFPMVVVATIFLPVPWAATSILLTLPIVAVSLALALPGGAAHTPPRVHLATTPA